MVIWPHHELLNMIWTPKCFSHLWLLPTGAFVHPTCNKCIREEGAMIRGVIKHKERLSMGEFGFENRDGFVFNLLNEVLCCPIALSIISWLEEDMCILGHIRMCKLL